MSVHAWNSLPLWTKGKTLFAGKMSPESVKHWSSTAEQTRVLLKTPSSKAPWTKTTDAVHCRLIPSEDAILNWCLPAKWRVFSEDVPPKERKNLFGMP